MNKRICVIMIGVLSLSVLLLGFSYAKESGTNASIGLSETNEDEFRVVYSTSDRISVNNENSIDISLINKKEEMGSFFLELTDVKESKDGEIYYTIGDDEEKICKNGLIYLGDLNSYESDGDHSTYVVKIRTNNQREFKLNVLRTESNLLTNEVMLSESAYRDYKGDFRYYGANANNYMTYNNQLFRIVGIIDGKIKIISEATNKAYYSETTNYLGVDDYLNSFNNDDSWLNIGTDYWVRTDDVKNIKYVSVNNKIMNGTEYLNIFVREVYEIDSDIVVTNGDGTLNSPFGVAYGS